MANRAWARRLTAVALFCLLLGTSVTAGATKSDADLRSERDQLRANRAALASQVNVADAELEDLIEALAQLEANLRAEEAQLSDAQRAVAAADERVTEALAAKQSAQGEVDQLRQTMATMAVNAYVSPPAQDELSVMLTGELGNAPERQALLEISSSNQAEVLEAFRAAFEDLEIQSQAAVAAQQRAEDSRREVEARLKSVAEARDQQATVAAQAQLRLDQMLAEANRLESAESQISSELAAREAARRAELERQRLAALERQLAAASARRGPVSVPGRGSIQLVSVGGITVNASIGNQLKQMLDAAAADGIILTGGGYRDSAQQIVLRRRHCGTTQYAIYQMPAGQCRPPTAQPGSSLHERGLAIDFQANGSSISSRNTAGFRWLAANAARFGFYNLPSEPWHWSTTGG